jgi:hypothetical protein
MLLKRLAAGSAESFAVLLQALLDDIIAFRQQMSAKPRRVARAA